MTRLSFLMICLFLIAGHTHSEKHAALFIFGDSLFDAGNNNYINTITLYQANFFPYGETFFKYPTGRFAAGRTIPDFIAEYAKLPFIPTFLPFKNQEFTSGVNFASGGAGALAETHQGLVISLQTQLSYFKKVKMQLKKNLGDAAAETLLSEAVYLINGGANDYIVPFTTNSTVLQSYETKKQYVDMVIGNITTAVKEIYKKGGRKFGFVNVMPLGCVPGFRALMPGLAAGSCVEVGLELPKMHNKALSKVIKELETQLKGFAYSKHDFYNSLQNRINNPSAYGFKKGTACCGSGPFRGSTSCGGKRGIKEYELCDNPDEYVFFDYVHLSEKSCKQIAEIIWSGTPNVTGPYNLKTLFELI